MIILMFALNRKTVNWRRSISDCNDVLVVWTPPGNPPAASRLPEWKWINVCVFMCVCVFSGSTAVMVRTLESRTWNLCFLSTTVEPVGVEVLKDQGENWDQTNIS